MREAVVLVHGLWSVAGVDMLTLKKRLSNAGYECHLFNYHVWGKPPAKIAKKLHEFIGEIASRSLTGQGRRKASLGLSSRIVSDVL